MWQLPGVEMLRNPGVANNPSGQSQLYKEPRCPSRLPLRRVRWRSGWCFPHFKQKRLWMFNELMVLADGFVWAGCQHISQTRAPARTLANTCSPNCFGLMHPYPLFTPQKPLGDSAPGAPLSLHCYLSFSNFGDETQVWLTGFSMS